MKISKYALRGVASLFFALSLGALACGGDSNADMYGETSQDLTVAWSASRSRDVPPIPFDEDGVTTPPATSRDYCFCAQCVQGPTCGNDHFSFDCGKSKEEISKFCGYGWVALMCHGKTYPQNVNGEIKCVSKD